MRQHSKEIELKLALTPADFRTLKAHRSFGELLSSPDRVERLVSVYYDTDKRDLHAHGATLRVRREGDSFIQTVKATGAANGMLQRDEWEQPLEDSQPDLDAAANTSLGAVLTAQVRAALKPIFETRIQRTYYYLADNDWRIEIAFDHGEVVAGNRLLPICEMELELKYGYRAALFELARMIVEVIPAQLSLVAKSERGYALVDEAEQQFFPARNPKLTPGTATANSFQSIANSCLNQLVANAPHVNRRNPEALHQVRIALRRLRTAISIFSDVVHDGQIERVKSELKWLNKQLSPARDLDMMLEEVVKPLHRQHIGNRGLWSLHHSFARQRLRNYQTADNALDSLRYCRLLIETFAWVEIGEWVTTTDEPAQLRRNAPIEVYAAGQLSSRRRKIKRRGRKLIKLDAAQLHRLRIQVKKMRYATEFFADLFHERKSARRGAKMLTALKRLQTSLGGLNDVTTRNALCSEILTQMDGATTRDGRDRAFAAGLIAGHQEARHIELLSDAAKAYTEFADVKPFWK
jgi:inorganic triphosphatase YgiF